MSPYRVSAGTELAVRLKRSLWKTLGWRLAVWWAVPLRRPRSPCCDHPYGKAVRSRRKWMSGRCDKCGLGWAYS